MPKHVAVTHFRPQVSDLFALWLIQQYGKPEQYNHIDEGMRLRYLRDGGRSLRDKDGEFRLRDETKTTHSGVGGGKYDEHGKEMIECEASLVGRDLGFLRDVTADDTYPSMEEYRRHVFKVVRGKTSKLFFVENERFRDLFAAVVRDDISGSPLYSFGNLTDTLFYMYPTGMRRVMNWSRALIEAASNHGAIKGVAREELHEEAAEIIFASLNMLEARSSYHEDSGIQLRNWLQEKQFIHRVEPLNIVDAVAVMKNAGANWHKWMLIILRAELATQHRFHTETPIEAKKARMIPVTIEVSYRGIGRLESRYLAFVETDDPFVHKYLLSNRFGYHVAMVVKKNSKGQVQIFPGSCLHENGGKTVKQSLSFLMLAVTAFVRARELTKRNLPIVSWDELISDHGPKNDFTWFFSSGPGWLMNGSLTAIDIPPTMLTLQEIEKAVLLGVSCQYDKERKRLISILKKR